MNTQLANWHIEIAPRLITVQLLDTTTSWELEIPYDMKMYGNFLNSILQHKLVGMSEFHELKEYCDERFLDTIATMTIVEPPKTIPRGFKV